VDARAGGRYRIGNELPDGTVIWITGEFVEVAPPDRLVFTWRSNPKQVGDELVTVRFEARGDETEVIVEHEGIASEPKREDHERGWIGCLDGLAAF